MALDQPRVGSSVVRGSALALLVVAFVVAIFFVDGRTARSGYPFLEAGPAQAPDILYLPSYVTVDIRPLGWTVGKDQYGNVDVEIRDLLSSGGELRIWETTRYDATVNEAVGPYHEGARLTGAFTVWRTGQTQNGRANLLYARIGPTLVVIVGELSLDELLRVADSMRRSTSSALML